jgi:hypothetical protein
MIYINTFDLFLDAYYDVDTGAYSGCLPRCNEARYKITQTHRPRETSGVSIIRVQFKDNSVIQYIRDDVYTTQDIIGICIVYSIEHQEFMHN